VVGGRGVAVIVGPGEGEVAGDERVAFGRNLPRHPHRGAVDLVDLVLQADGSQLVVARVERHRGQELGARAHELTMELGQRLGMLDGHLRGERSGLDVPALLQLQQVPAITEHGSLRQALQDPLRHVAPPSRVDPLGQASVDSASVTGRTRPVTEGHHATEP
jgi:hypothetical protein